MKGRKDKIIIIVTILIMFLSTVFMLNYIIKSIKNIEGDPDDILYINTLKDNINYEIFLKENDFLVESSLNENFSYVTELIEYIEVNFNYEYTNNSDMNLSYNYFISADIKVEPMNDSSKLTKPIMIKKSILLEEDLKKLEDKKFVINEKLNIGMDYYNDFVKDFIEFLKAPVQAYLDILLVVQVTDEIDVKNYEMKINVPLAENIIEINTLKNFDEQEIYYEKEPIKAEVRYVIIIFYITLVLTINISGIYIIKLIINKKYNKYWQELNKILKEYDDRMITVLNFIDYSKWEIVDTPTFNELIDMANEAFEPIIFWEQKGKNKEAWFCILKNKIIYRYKIANSDK